MASYSMHELPTLSNMLASNAAIDQSHVPETKRVSRTDNLKISSEHARLCHPRKLDRGTRHPSIQAIVFQLYTIIDTVFIQHHCICFYRR
jgi:hypothetical protein